MPIQQRTIKGQPYLNGKSLMQDQILLVSTDGKRVQYAEGTTALLPDIWADLKSATGTWKRSKNYFYWEIDVSDTSDDAPSGAIVKYRYECPKPGPDLFDYDYTAAAGDSDWVKYWKAKFKATESSPYVSTGAMFKTEVILPGTKYIKFGRALHQGQDESKQNPDGTWSTEEIKIPEATVDVDDAMNLLSAGRAYTGPAGSDLSDLTGLLGGMV